MGYACPRKSNSYKIVRDNDDIVDVRTDGTQVLQQDAFVNTLSGTQRRVITTKGWEVNLKWKDGSTTWKN